MHKLKPRVNDLENLDNVTNGIVNIDSQVDICKVPRGLTIFQTLVDYLLVVILVIAIT